MEKIAIVGMGCLFPDAENPQQFWENLINNKDCTTLLNETILGKNPDVYLASKRGTPDKIKYNKNGHINHFKFNPEGYNTPAEELLALDELFQWTIYAVDQALQDSGYKNKKEFLEKSGLILGNIAMPTMATKKLYSSFYHKMLEPYIQQLLNNQQFRFNDYWGDNQLSRHNIITASLPSVLACQEFGLNGPSFSLDAACSTALYAINCAADYLNTGEADIMLAASICRADYIYLDHGFNILQAMPDNGECKPFDRSSEGLKAGEGVGVLVLKRLPDAVRDNDKIYSIIEGIGLSNDAGAKHILVPDETGQVLALNRAYSDTPKDVDYIECHATGTPVGDEIELNSIDSFYSDQEKAPLIGANKCNVGHLLTASGMPSIFKVILSMKHGIIPATIGVDDALNSRNNRISRDNMVLDNTAWPDKSRPKRAGVNAFGFGGTNGHIVLKEYVKDAEKVSASKIKKELEEMSIIGYCATFGEIDKNDEFNEAMYQADQVFKPLPTHRWSGLETRADLLKNSRLDINRIPEGSYVEKVDFDCIKFKIPPKMIEMQLLSHMSMLRTAERACSDAGIEANGKARNIAVIIGGEMDPSCLRYQARNEIAWHIQESLEKCNIKLGDEKLEQLQTILKESLFPAPYVEGVTGGINNIVACRIASFWKFNGPSFFISAQENSAIKAMQLAQFLLTFNDIDAVVVGASDFSAGYEQFLYHHCNHPVNSGEKTLSFDVHSNGWNIGEGGGAIVLKRTKDAKKNNDRIYSTIKSLKILHDSRGKGLEFIPAAEKVAQVSQKCLEQAGLKPENIGYLEAHASGFAREDQAELEGLTTAYQSSRAQSSCAVGSVKSNIGHTFAASGLAGIIRTSLALYNRYIPGTPRWSQPKDQSLWEKSLFYVTPETKTWPEQGKNRLAAVNVIGSDHSYSHLILEEPDEETRKNARKIAEEDSSKKKLNMTVILGRKPIIKEMIINERNVNDFKQVALQNNAISNSQTAEFKGSKVMKGDNNKRLEEFREKLINIVSEKTGYPSDMIDLDMDLEADMGIDSIKRVEIIGTLFEGYNDQDQKLDDMDSLDLDDFKTLRNILDFLEERMAEGGGSADNAVAAEQVIQQEKEEEKTVPTPPVVPEITPINTVSKSRLASAPVQITGSNSSLNNESRFVASTATQPEKIEKPVQVATMEPVEVTSDTVESRAQTPTQPPGQDYAEQITGLTHPSIQKELVRMANNHKKYLEAQEKYYEHLKALFNSQPGTQSQTVNEPIARPAFLDTPEPIQPKTQSAPANQFVTVSSAASTSTVSPLKNETVEAAAPVASPPVQPVVDNVDSSPAVKINLEEFKEKLVNIVSEKTGYPSDMIDLDMDLEADMGIDSIKRVEIIGTLFEGYNDQDQKLDDMDSLDLDDFKTLRNILDFLEERFTGQSSGSGTVVSPAAPVQTASPGGAGGQSSDQQQFVAISSQQSETLKQEVKQKSAPVDAVGFNIEEFREKLVNIVSEKTGYPSDMIDLDMDLEADMGIDSIKRVEIIGTLFEGYNDQDQKLDDMDSLDLDDFKTLRNILDFLKERFGQGASQSSATETVASPAAPVQTASPGGAGGQSSDQQQFVAISSQQSETLKQEVKQKSAPVDAVGFNIEEFREKLVNIVSEKTGYPSDMIDLDMDLEADMGIDSIKRVEIIGTLFEGYNDQDQKLDDMDSLDLDDFKTLRNILDFLKERFGQSQDKINAAPVRTESPQEAPSGNEEVIFDEKQLVELTDGKVANILGGEYAEADQYEIRTRMPSPPFMFATRITKLTAVKDKLEPCVVEWEYDIPKDAYYVSHGRTPAMVSLESSHAMIVAFTYIGCDQLFKGELSYRALDSQTTVYSDFPRAGDTFNGQVFIKSFTKAGKNVLVNYEYNCFVDQRLVFKLEANSGFFPFQNLQKARSMPRPAELTDSSIEKKSFAPILNCKKTRFSDEDINAIQEGKLDQCFGPGFGETEAPGLCAPKIKMINRILSIDPKGGSWGLGEVVSETDIHTDHWVFKAHFKNDPCVPGTLLVEGCEQLLKFYMYYLGFHSISHLKPAVMIDHKFSAKFRGEVKCKESKIQFRLTIKDIIVQYKADGKTYQEIKIVGIVETLSEGKVIGINDNMGIRLVDR